MPVRLSASLLVLAAAVLHAQQPAVPAGGATSATAIIAGHVVDASNGTPIAGAVVSIPLRNQGTLQAQQAPRVLTDAQGRFFFRDLAAGSYTLSATKNGWIPGAYGRGRPGGATLALDVADGERRADLTVSMWRFAVISGRIVDEAGDPMVGLDVRAIEQTYIAGHRQLSAGVRMRTDDRGVYRFAGLMPGDYFVAVPATITAQPANMPSIIDTQTYLQTMTAVGTAPTSLEQANVQTGADRFLIASVPGLPGVPADEGSWPTYPTTFYPSSTSLTAATTVRAVSGRDRSEVDLVVRPSSTYQVSGIVAGPDGPAAFHALHLIPADVADASVFDTATAVSNSDGSFTFYGVPPGQYIARVVRTPWPSGEGSRLGIVSQGGDSIKSVMTLGGGPNAGPPSVPTEPLLHADVAVSVGSRSVRDLTIVMRAGPRVRGRAEFRGSAAVPTPAQLSGVGVVLERTNGQQYSAIVPGRFGDDRQFTTPSMWPGRYFVRVSNPPAGWTFVGATYQGRDISETALDLSVDIENVLVMFTDHPGKIEGTVEAMSSGRSVAVMLFPTDAASWTGFGRNSRRIRSTAVSATGTFTLSAPPAGEYLLVAIPDEESANWQSPAVLQKLAGVAERVQVRDGQPTTQALRLRHIQ